MYHHTIVGIEMETAVDEILKKIFKDGYQQFKRLIVCKEGKLFAAGDLPLILIYRSGQLEMIKERFNDCVAVCRMKREGIKGTFKNKYSLQEAMTDGLMKKPEWNDYARHILKFKARQLTISQAFPDILEGMGVADCGDEKCEEVNKILQESKTSPTEEAREVLRQKISEGETPPESKGHYVDEELRAKLLREVSGAE